MSSPLAAHAAAFARLALSNITREYPNFPAHLVEGPEGLVPPRVHHPAFYGAYDWHSAVHMHWLLVRLLRRHPDRLDRAAVAAALDGHLSPGALAAEADYLRAHPSFERPYGWAWALALAAEVRALAVEDGGADTARWAEAVTPLAEAVDALVRAWLPRATYPVRHGTHANSAFALGLVLDAAPGAGVPELAEPVADTLRAWFLGDHGAALRWEPSGQDFLSPLLVEADAVRRVLPRAEFAEWLGGFLPELSTAVRPFLTPPRVSDPADPQVGHLLGLCLSRAAVLSALAAALPERDPRVPVLAETARLHLDAGLPAVSSSGDFTTDHWLATFAVLALEAPGAGTAGAPGAAAAG